MIIWNNEQPSISIAWNVESPKVSYNNETIKVRQRVSDKNQSGISLRPQIEVK